MSLRSLAWNLEYHPCTMMARVQCHLQRTRFTRGQSTSEPSIKELLDEREDRSHQETNGHTEQVGGHDELRLYCTLVGLTS